jgi:hypothetical protein
MKMAISYWADLNHLIKFENTKKQYFSRYLWRLVYRIPRVSVVSDRYVTDIVDYLHEVKRDSSSYNSTSYWADADIDVLSRLRVVVNDNKHRAKFRTEGDLLQVYTETEQDLIDIAKEINQYRSIKTVTGPQPGTEDALRNGVVYMSKIDYKYKIVLRDGNYPLEIKRNILAQLRAHDDIKIPSSLAQMLVKKYPALWGGYFYCNDDRIATFLTLMSPGIIGKIHAVEHLQ